ncbi:unnamed protein product, partial [marine sediment metagenome]
TTYFYRKTFFSKKAFKSTIIFLLGLTLIYGLYFIAFKGVNSQKSQATIFTQEGFIKDINKNIDASHKSGLPLVFVRIFFNKFTKVGLEFGKRYFSIFNPAFLFFSGDKEPFSDLSPADIPNFYPYLLPFFIAGIYYLSKNDSLKESRFIFCWLLIAGITSGFVNISPNTTKLMDFHLVILIISALGFFTFLCRFKKYRKQIIAVFSFILIFCQVHFLISYFLVFPKKASKEWLFGLDKVIDFVKTLDYDYKHFFIQRDGAMELVYINFAFYTPFDPIDFSKHSQRSAMGFNRVESYREYIFDIPPHTRSIKEYNDFIDKYGKSLCLSEYEFKQANWEEIKVFYFEGEPKWILQKRY